MADKNNLHATDDFAFLGLERQYQLAPAQLDAAVARVTAQISAAGDASGELQQRLLAARERLSDPVKRGNYLLDLLVGPSDVNPGVVPDSLKVLAQQVASAADPAAVNTVRLALNAERQGRLDHIAQVFSFPRNVPNPVAQHSRDTAIRNDLRAVAFIDQSLSQLASRGQ
jgi:hypothetical protein